MKFEDHFSKAAAAYARYRPGYPDELFDYLAGLTPEHELAWDCATGSGQAAVGLARHYRSVLAADASPEQISRAEPHPRITYRVEPAEKTALESRSVDLAAAAVAVHWFDFEPYYAEVRRVLKPGGAIAVWTYHRPQVNPGVDALIAHLEDEVLGGCWPERIRYLREHYQTLPFPFDELAPPDFAIQAEWSLDQMLGFISSWSASRCYEAERGTHPARAVWDDFVAAWGGEAQTQLVRWPLYLRVGKVAG